MKEHKEQLYEMANYDIDKTGLDHGFIYVDNIKTNHGPRVRYYRGRPGKNKLSSVITITKPPELVENSLNITSQELKEVVNFVALNYTHLMRIYLRGEVLSTTEWDRGIKPIS